jgi:hypothetical protein
MPFGALPLGRSTVIRCGRSGAVLASTELGAHRRIGRMHVLYDGFIWKRPSPAKGGGMLTTVTV